MSNILQNKTQNILHIYCRVSTEMQVEKGHSLLAQEKAGIEVAKRLGLGYKIHTEAGQSAASDDTEFKNRPVLKSLLNLCDDGVVKNIFVTEQDRLSRSPLSALFIKKILIDNNIRLHTGNQQINLNDPEQSFITDLATLLAKRERDLFVKRSKRGVVEGAKKGHWPGIILPYGYRRNQERSIEIDQEEAEVYKKIVDLSLAGHGTNTIARKLNELEIETRCKKVLLNGTKVKNKYTGSVRKVHNEEFVWRAGTVYCILTNSIYKGERKFKNEIIYAPAIIEKDIWEKIQLNLKRNKNNSCNNASHFYLLKGKLRCANCGSNLYGKIKKDEKNYMCSSKRQKPCGLRSVNLDELNNKVWDLLTNDELQLKSIKDEIKSKNAPAKLAETLKKKKGVENQIKEIEARKEKIIILFEKDKIDLKEFESRSKSLESEKKQLVIFLKSSLTEITELENQIKYLNESVIDSKILNTVNLWSNEEKKAYVDRKIKNIKVYWNPSVWQHLIEVVVEFSGFFIPQYFAIVASNKPKGIFGKQLNTYQILKLISNPVITKHHIKH